MDKGFGIFYNLDNGINSLNGFLDKLCKLVYGLRIIVVKFKLPCTWTKFLCHHGKPSYRFRGKPQSICEAALAVMGSPSEFNSAVPGIGRDLFPSHTLAAM